MIIETWKAIHGDCIEEMKKIDSKSIDMILCDLPYWTTQNKWDSIIPLEELWEQYERIIKDDGAIVLFAQTPFDKVLGVSNLKLLKYEWIWEKTNATWHLNAKKMPMKAHENILVFYKNQPKYNPMKTEWHERKVSSVDHRVNAKFSSNYGDQKESGYDSTERYPRSVQIFKKDVQKSKLHPTQKPIELCEYLIKTYTDPWETILDNAAWSFTTAVACENTWRKWICIEKEKEYFDIWVKRLESI